MKYDNDDLDTEHADRDVLDKRVRHAGKAGSHHNRALAVRRGMRRRPKYQAPKHERYLVDYDG